MPTTPKDQLYRIVREGLCTGCGLCQSIAGKDVVRVCKVTSEYERPLVVGELNQSTVDQIYAACPGLRVSGVPDTRNDPRAKHDDIWGPWHSIETASASDPETQFIGSTGGVLTALAIYLLESGRVDFILHATASDDDPAFGQAHISFTAKDVQKGAGSRYGPTAPLRDIHSVLDRGQPFAFIGKPCDISALRNLGLQDARVGELVKYWLTPVCGGYAAPPALNAFLDRINIERSDVTALRYRGYGCPGPTRVETDKTTKEVHYLDFWGEDASAWHLPFRCKICPDGIGEAADIAAADTWPGGSPTREGSLTDPGLNAVIARTAQGSELLKAAERDGALSPKDSATPEDLNLWQPHQKRKKQTAGARHKGLRDMGRLAPETDGLRIEALARSLSPEEFEIQHTGTQSRVQNGKATEPDPSLPDS